MNMSRNHSRIPRWRGGLLVFLLLGWGASAGAATFTVDTKLDIDGADVPGQRSLRWAINQSNANGNAEADLIKFSLAVGSTIRPSASKGQLPILTAGRCTIKGDKNGDNIPDIILDGSSLPNGSGLEIRSADNVLWGLVIVRFPHDGVLIKGPEAQRNRVRTCYLGIDRDTDDDLGNARAGVEMNSGAQNNTLGGNTAAYRNVISGNDQAGVFILGSGTDGNQVQGNYIGLNKAGDAAVANSNQGIRIALGAKSNLIGGDRESQRNVISGNAGGGLQIAQVGTDNNVAIGNYVGTDASGTVAIPNVFPGSQGAVGIYQGAQHNRIGGSTPGERNVISGNQGVGVGVQDWGTDWNQVQGNYIGTNAAGTAALPNGTEGARIAWGASNNTIGGTVPGQGNLISGNNARGVLIGGSFRMKSNQVQGNYIGTDVTGTAALPNLLDGVWIENGSNHTVGPGNVISGNGQRGIVITGHTTRNIVVKGNSIGTDQNGTIDLGNAWDGVGIADGVKGTTVGGSTAAARNVISGNDWNGIRVWSHVYGNKVQGNYIGTDKTGALPIPNAGMGVFLHDMAEVTTIGGRQAGQRNVISGNGIDGIRLSDGGTDFNLVQGNYIGTDATGTLPLGNVRDGIRIGEGGVPQYNLIGGATANARNIISANGGYGVFIGWTSDNNEVRGNYIGTDKTGTVDRGNILAGVYVGWDVWNTIVAGNLISGNDQYGIGPDGGVLSQIVGNYIGTDKNGTAALPNGGNGINLRWGGNNTIGGPGPTDRNLIAGNLGHGIYVTCPLNTFQGNTIGANLNGAPLGNTGSGIYLDSGGDGNLCQGNLITDNLDDAITLRGTWNRLTQNSTYGNDDLGIDWNADGVTDPAPLKIDSIRSAGGGTYTVQGTAPAHSTVEVFLADADPSGCGEGQTFLAETTADNTGKWSVGIVAGASQPITATAFPHGSQGNNTSEFCQNVNTPSG